MAVYRTPPKCPKCGGEIEAVYDMQEGIPLLFQRIGDNFFQRIRDNFIRWDWEGHLCKGTYEEISGFICPECNGNGCDVCSQSGEL